MYPDEIAKTGTEHAHQAALFCFTAVAHRHGFSAAFMWANQEDTLENIVKKHGSWPIAALRWLYAIPNGGSRGDSGKSRAIRGAQMKAEGVKAGVPDIFLPCPVGRCAGLYIEMKKPVLGPKVEGTFPGLSKEQKEFAKYATSVGYDWQVCYSWREAARVLQTYLLSD